MASGTSGFENWIVGYIGYRYGISSAGLEEAWAMLLETAYGSPLIMQEEPPESIFCARPALEIKSVSSWGTRKRNYNLAKFEAAAKLFVDAGDQYENCETYQTDKIAFVR